MLSIAIGFLRFAWPFILIGLAYLWANNACWNAACKRATERADEAQAIIAQVKAREAAIASLWAAQVDKTEAAARVAEGKRNETFDGIADRARRVAPGASLRLDSDTLRVFADASENANAARPPAVDQEPAATVSAPAEVSESALALWAVEAARAYASAYGSWQACVAFYEELRHGQSEANPD